MATTISTGRSVRLVHGTFETMDSLYKALSLFKRRKYMDCADVCTKLLEEQPYDQAAWTLKMRALTQKVYVDDIESEEVPESDFLDDTRVATAPRPGTSLRTTNNAVSARPQTSGRPISGVARPGTQSRLGTALDRLKTSRPLTGQSARAIRLGTAAMLNQKDGPFVQVSRLNIAKYAKDSNVSKPLFEYLFYYEGDVRNAMELAEQATQHCQFKDWWWKVQLAKCYVALNLLRDAEQQLRSALKQHHHVETFIRLTRIYVRLDQPLSAMDVCRAGFEVFPNDVSIETELARLHEAMGELAVSIKHYRNIVTEDAMNVEGIACIGLQHFYNNQPEIAIRYYRRILAMGAHSAELYNNIGLCCLYSQQLDLTLPCFQRALDLAVDPKIQAEVWYNLSHVAIAAGDLELAMQCLGVCQGADAGHAAALNNLAVLHHRLDKRDVAGACLAAASALEPDAPEPNSNLDTLLRNGPGTRAR